MKLCKQTSLFTLNDSIIIKHSTQSYLTAAPSPPFTILHTLTQPQHPSLEKHERPHGLACNWCRTGPASGTRGLMHDLGPLPSKRAEPAAHKCAKVDYCHRKLGRC